MTVIERRYGRFAIPRHVWETHPIVCRRLMGTVFVTRAEFLAHSDEFHYVAWSEHFAVVKFGDDLPWYVATVHDDGAFVTWERML